MVAHDGEQPNEDVDEVQVDRQGAVDRVVDRSLDVLGAVEVEDDVSAEEEDSDPVEPRQRSLDRESEETGERDEQTAQQEQDQAPEEERRPALQALGDHRAHNAQDHDHGDRDGEDLDHRRHRVESDDGPQHEPERDRDQRVAQQAHERVVAPHRDEDAQDGNDEGHQQGLPGHGPGQAHVGGDGRGGDTRSGPSAQEQVEGVATEGVLTTTLTFPDGFSDAHDGTPYLRWIRSFCT